MTDAEKERAAIVAWLRGPLQERAHGKMLPHYATLFANAIERGDHHK